MRRISLVFLLAFAGCAAGRAVDAGEAPLAGPGAVLRAPELARVRCLLVAPLENGTDAPHAAEAATSALLSAVDASRTKVFPVSELRAMFRDTPLELPHGISPSLALELAELVGADAALWGSVEGRASGSSELVVTLRLSLVADHQLLFADTALVKLAQGDATEGAVRRAVLRAARPMLARLGDPGRKRCFDAERSRALRKLALAEVPDARPAPPPAVQPAPSPPAPAAQPSASAPAPAPAASAGSIAQPAAAPSAAAAPARATAAPAPGNAARPVEPRTPRQADWAKRLAGRERFLAEGITFPVRAADPKTGSGLDDLAAALLAQPSVAVRLEGFVDQTSDRAADTKLSQAMAEAVARRLVKLGVPRARVTAAGRGGDSPVLPNFTTRGRAANRRIEVVALP